MEQRDLRLINQLLTTNETLKKLMSDHQQFEHQLQSLAAEAYLTPSQKVERKRIQKLKLRGRDRIETILASTRRTQFAASI